MIKRISRQEVIVRGGIYMETTGIRVLTHASAFFAPYLVPIIVFFITQDELLKRLAIQAVLFQLIVGVMITISIVFSFIIIGIPFLVFFGIVWLIVPILGILAALRGEHYEYPIVKHFF